MKKELVINILKEANKLENLRQNTDNIEYYPTEFNVDELDTEDYLYKLIEEDKILLNSFDRSITISYLKSLGKSTEYVSSVLDNLFRYNNIDLDYLYFGNYETFLTNLEFDKDWIKTAKPNEIKKAVCNFLAKVFSKKIDLTGYVQNRDIRYSEVIDQIDFEEEAYREDSKRKCEYTSSDSYEITENYVNSYYTTVSLSIRFLKLMGINRDKGFKLQINSGKNCQIFNRIALYAIKNFRLMRIPGIEAFTGICQNIISRDGNLTKSEIDLFNSELNNLIKIIEEPDCYKYIMMELSDTDLFEMSDCVFLYSKICRMLDLTDKDVYNLMINGKNTDDEVKLYTKILENMGYEEVQYYEDNLDYQDEYEVEAYAYAE